MPVATEDEQACYLVLSKVIFLEDVILVTYLIVVLVNYLCAAGHARVVDVAPDVRAKDVIASGALKDVSAIVVDAAGSPAVVDYDVIAAVRAIERNRCRIHISHCVI